MDGSFENSFFLWASNAPLPRAHGVFVYTVQSQVDDNPEDMKTTDVCCPSECSEDLSSGLYPKCLNPKESSKSQLQYFQ